MRVVSNASPLINLARIGELRLLHHLYGELLIPHAVWQEVVVEGAAKQRGLIDSLESHLATLRDVAGFRLSEALYSRVLRDESERT